MKIVDGIDVNFLFRNNVTNFYINGERVRELKDPNSKIYTSLSEMNVIEFS